MKIVINDQVKKNLFCSLFNVLKNCSNIISIICKSDGLFIQGMDKSHVCLFQVNISKNWFYVYEISMDKDNEDIINIDCAMFYTVLSVANENYNVEIIQDNNDKDNIMINLVSFTGKKECFDKYFKIPLVDFEIELFEIPNVDYDAEFSINSKNITEIANQMLVFGTDINIICTEEKINLVTNGVTGQMTVNIPIEDLNEYSIIENQTISLKYSLNYIGKMCLTNKLSSNIDLLISLEYPMKIKYDLGQESSLVFYIAPKIVDDF